MPLLNLDSKIDQKDQPIANEWDTLRRKTFNKYQIEIEKYRYAFQQWLRLPCCISWMFPYFYQNQVLDFTIIKNLQTIGNYKENEISEYELINPNIRNSLKRSFGTSFPKEGVIIGIPIFLFMGKTKFNLFQTIGVSVIPAILQTYYMKWDITPKHETKSFLQWVIQNRTAQSHLEKNIKKINKDEITEFKSLFPQKSCFEITSQLFKYLDK